MIDHALSRFRSYLPDVTPDETAKRDLARRVIATAGALPAPRQTRRRGLVVATATGLAAVGALGIVMTKVDRRSSAAPVVVGEARVDWGMQALITVTPDPGVSVEDATQRAKELILERLRQLDVQGAEVSSPKPGQLSLMVPGAEAPSQFSFLAEIPHVRIFRKQQVIASGRTLADLRTSLGARRPGPQVRYLVGSTTDAAMPALPRLVDSMDDVRRLTSQRTYPVLAIDREWTFAMDPRTGVTMLLTGVPVVPAADVTLRLAGTSPVVTYPTSTAAWSDDMLVVTSGVDSLIPDAAGTAISTRAETTTVGTSDTVLRLSPKTVGVLAPSTGHVVFLNEQIHGTQRSASGDVGATSFSRYGSAPEVGGVKVKHPQMFAHENARWLRLFSSRSSGARMIIYRWELSKHDVGTDFALMSDSGGGLFGPLVVTGSNSPWCPVGLGAPTVNPCIDYGLKVTTKARPGMPIRTSLLSAGRVASDVTNIEVRLMSGRVVSGDIQGTWYAVLTDTAISAADWKSPATLVARDGDGRVLQEQALRLAYSR